MTYKSRQYGEKDGHKLMMAIIAQKKNYNNEQERKRKKKTKEMNSKTLLGGIEANVGHEMNNVNLVMASNTQDTQEHNNNNYELCIVSSNISKKGEFKKPNTNIDNYVEEDRWDYSNEWNKWEGGGLSNNYEPKQNRMLENYVCNDIIKNDEVANILLSLNRKTHIEEFM